jgi:hypothetical protein
MRQLTLVLALLAAIPLRGPIPRAQMTSTATTAASSQAASFVRASADSWFVTELADDRDGPQPNTAARDLLVRQMPDIAALGYRRLVAVAMYPQLGGPMLPGYIKPLQDAAAANGITLSIGCKLSNVMREAPVASSGPTRPGSQTLAASQNVARAWPPAFDWLTAGETWARLRDDVRRIAALTGTSVYLDCEELWALTKDAPEWRGAQLFEVRARWRTFVEGMDADGISLCVYALHDSYYDYPPRWIARPLMRQPTSGAARSVTLLISYPYFRGGGDWPAVLQANREYGYRCLPGLIGAWVGANTDPAIGVAPLRPADRDAWIVANSSANPVDHWWYCGTPEMFEGWKGMK